MAADERVEEQAEAEESPAGVPASVQALTQSLQLHRALDQGVQVLVGVLARTDIMALPRLERMKAFEWLREQASRERGER